MPPVRKCAYRLSPKCNRICVLITDAHPLPRGQASPWVHSEAQLCFAQLIFHQDTRNCKWGTPKKTPASCTLNELHTQNVGEVAGCWSQNPKEEWLERERIMSPSSRHMPPTANSKQRNLRPRTRSNPNMGGLPHHRRAGIHSNTHPKWNRPVPLQQHLKGQPHPLTERQSWKLWLSLTLTDILLVYEKLCGPKVRLVKSENLEFDCALMFNWKSENTNFSSIYLFWELLSTTSWMHLLLWLHNVTVRV